MQKKKTTQLNFHHTNAPLVDRTATASDLEDADAATREVTRRSAMVTFKLPIFLFCAVLVGRHWPAAAALRFSWSNESRENKTRRLVSEKKTEREEEL